MTQRSRTLVRQQLLDLISKGLLFAADSFLSRCIDDCMCAICSHQNRPLVDAPTPARLPHSLGGRLVPYIINVRLSSNPLRLIARLLFCARSNIETKAKQTTSSLLQTRTPFKACAVCRDSSAQAPKTAADFLQNPQLAQKS